MARAQRSTFAIAVAALTAILAGCGQRGPLTLPDEAVPPDAAVNEADETADDETEEER